MVLYYRELKTGNRLNSYRRFDAGLSLGIVRPITDYLELNIERGFTKPDKGSANEIIFQEAGLIGIRYFFLRLRNIRR